VSDRFAAACSLGSSKEKAALHHLLQRPDAAVDAEVVVGDILEGKKSLKEIRDTPEWR
jgi:hypothetical protein